MKVAKPVKRETAINYRGTALMVEIHPRHLEIWRKRDHQRYVIGYEGLYERAAIRAAEAARRERLAEKAALRKAVR